jgi:hypothetical protein
MFLLHLPPPPLLVILLPVLLFIVFRFPSLLFLHVLNLQILHSRSESILCCLFIFRLVRFYFSALNTVRFRTETKRDVSES